jgi:hypothetical protein
MKHVWVILFKSYSDPHITLDMKSTWRTKKQAENELIRVKTPKAINNYVIQKFVRTE